MAAWNNAWNNVSNEYSKLKTRVENLIAVHDGIKEKKKLPSIKGMSADEEKATIRRMLKNYLTSRDDALSSNELIEKYRAELTDLCKYDKDTVDSFGHVNTWWVFGEVAPQLNYGVFMAEIDNVGYKRTKRGEREMPNELFDLEYAPQKLDIAAISREHNKRIADIQESIDKEITKKGKEKRTDKIVQIEDNIKAFEAIKADDLLKIELRNIPISEQNVAVSKIEPIEKDIKRLKATVLSIQDVIDSVFQREFNFDYDTFEELKTHKTYTLRQSLFSNNPDLRFSAKYHRPAGDFVMEQLTGITDKKIKHFFAEPIVLGASISPSDFDENGEAYYVSMATIKTLEVELDETQLVSPIYYESRKAKSIQKGDIIVARSGVSIGKTAIVKDDFDGIFADFTMRIRFDDTKYNPMFAYYYLRSKYFQYLIEIYKKGLQNQNIFPIVMQEFPIPDILFSEQRHILNEIQAEISKQDEIKNQIAELRRQIEDIIIETVGT